MEAEPVPEKSVDDVLDQIDWEKLGSQGAEEKAELPLPGKTEPLPPAHFEAPAPAQMARVHHGADIQIVRKWFGCQAVVMAAFTVFLGWFTVSKVSTITEDGNLPELLFLAVGIVLAYYSLARLLNRTRIVVSHDRITVRHGPLPWPGNKKLDPSNCRRFYWDEKEYHGRRGTTRIYKVRASTRDGRRVKLLGGLIGLTEEQARFVVEELEEIPGLKDSPREGTVFNWLHS